MKTDYQKGARTALTVLAAAAVLACSQSQAEPATSLQTTNVVKGALRITVEATGTVEPIRKVEVKSKASGEVQSLAVDVGDQVQTGALLARIDPRDVRNSYDQAAADLEVAQARLEISQAQNQRSKELLEGGVITAQEYENSRLDLANAQAALIKAQTNNGLAELRLGDVTIVAPLSGTIIQKSIEEGQVIQSASQNVSGGTTLFVMANLNEMQVRTLVDETDMGQINPGMPVSVQVEAFSGRQFQGYVDKVEPQAVVQQSVTMFPVIIRLDNRDGTLRPGMNAEVEILIDEASDILLVPNNAIVLPQDVLPAAAVLGIDPESIDMAALGGRERGGRGQEGGGEGAGPGADAAPAEGVAAAPAGPAAGRGGAVVQAPREGAPGAEAAGNGAQPAGRGAGPQADSLRARMARGEINQDSARVLMRGVRGGTGGGQGLGNGQGGGAARGAGLGAARGTGVLTETSGQAAARPRQLRRAVVFVLNAEGKPEPRAVQIGLNDYDHTQVLSGLEEGDQVALLGAAELQAQQQQFLNRVRQGAGGMGGFGGGGVMMGPGGGGGGGGRGR